MERQRTKVISKYLYYCTCANFSLFFEQDEFYCNPAELNAKENGGVAVVRGHRVVKLDVVERKAVLDNGLTVTTNTSLPQVS